jgi:hypothetical protein
VSRDDVKARHDARTRRGKPQIPNLKPQTPNPRHQGRAGHDRTVGLVETMLKLHVENRTLTADGLRAGRTDGLLAVPAGAHVARPHSGACQQKQGWSRHVRGPLRRVGGSVK